MFVYYTKKELPTSRATVVTITTYGIITGLVGIEHALGEILQGDQAPDGVVFTSWPNSAFFRSVAGEPAMSLIPNFLTSGIATFLVSAAILLWSIRFAPRKWSGFALILLSIALLLVGGGFGPPHLGIIIGLAALKNHSGFAWTRTHVRAGILRGLSASWPAICGMSLACWFMVMPGVMLLDLTFGLGEESALVYAIILAAFGTLFLAILAGYARDAVQAVARQ